MTFPLPQFGIFAQGSHAHHFLEFDLKPGGDGRRTGSGRQAAERSRRPGRDERDGKELEIFRRCVPFGTAGEHGLYFVAFSAQRSC